MAVNIKKRVFGSDIDPLVKAKLRLRQEYARTSDANEARERARIDETGKIYGTDQSFRDKDYGVGVNFPEYGTGKILADLSSRTPFVRMWTAVQEYDLYHTTAEQHREDQEYAEGQSQYGPTTAPHDGTQGYEDSATYENKDVIVYEVGNHVYNTLTLDANQSVWTKRHSTHGSFYKVGDVKKAKEENMITSNFKDVFETNENEFLRPPAGITQVTSETIHMIGVMRETTVNFVVHNFHDYDNIYSRFFLKPGAQVWVDIGWDTIDIYDPLIVLTRDEQLPKEITKNNAHGAEGIIWGVNGYMARSKGDMLTLCGFVTNYDTKIKDNGSVECSITIVSRNTALMSANVFEDETIKSKLANSLEKELIKFGASYFKESDENTKEYNLYEKLARADWTSSSETVTEWSKQLTWFAETKLTTDDPVDKLAAYPSSKLLRTGVWYGNINSNKFKLFVCWGLFEDLILNANFAHGVNLNSINTEAEQNKNEIPVKFDSSNSWTRWNRHLFRKQMRSYNNLEKLDFIYPGDLGIFNLDADVTVSDDWGKFGQQGYKSYNTQRNKWPVNNEGERDKWWKDLDSFSGENIKIPLRELYVSVDLLKEAITEKSNLSEMLNHVFERLEQKSGGIISLALSNPDQSDSRIEIVDLNWVHAVDSNIQAKKDVFDNLFEFKPNSDNTIVKKFDASFTMPQGNLGNWMAINAMTPGQKFTATDKNIAKFLAGTHMEMLEDPMKKDRSTVYKGIKYIPEIGSYQTNRLDKTKAGEYGFTLDLYEADARLIQESDKNIKDLLDDMGGRSKKIVETVDDADTYRKFINTQGEKLEKEEGTSKEIKVDRPVVSDEEHNEWESNTAFEKAKPPKTYNSAIQVTSLDKYDEAKGREATYNHEESMSQLLPWTLNLGIYGIASLNPGDIFNVDYLPRRWRENAYWQIIKVVHNVSPSTWTTELQTQIRYRPQKNPLIEKPDVYLDRRILEGGGNFNISLLNYETSGLKRVISRLKPVNYTVFGLKDNSDLASGKDTIAENFNMFTFKPKVSTTLDFYGNDSADKTTFAPTKLVHFNPYQNPKQLGGMHFLNSKELTKGMKSLDESGKQTVMKGAGLSINENSSEHPIRIPFPEKAGGIPLNFPDGFRCEWSDTKSGKHAGGRYAASIGWTWKNHCVLGWSCKLYEENEYYLLTWGKYWIVVPKHDHMISHITLLNHYFKNLN